MGRTAFIQIGDRIGHLTVIDKVLGESNYICKCDCGKICKRDSETLKRAFAFNRDIFCSRACSLKYVGLKFGYLSILEVTDKKTKAGKTICICKCDCGNVVEKKLSSVVRGEINKCGKYCRCKRDDIVGVTFGDLTVLSFSHEDSLHQPYYVCMCKCGSITIVRKTLLVSGVTRSCGCHRRKLNKEKKEEKFSSDGKRLSKADGKRLSKRNTSGVTGVYFDKTNKKWRAYMTINGVKKYLGNFKDKQDAIDARERAIAEYKISPNR